MGARDGDGDAVARANASSPIPPGEGSGVGSPSERPAAEATPHPNASSEAPTAPAEHRQAARARQHARRQLGPPARARVGRARCDGRPARPHADLGAIASLDAALERSRARGDRVILLITGKPPRRDSERPHARGAIRAAVGDWLHASRHADAIAAVRGASPRHGGAGALYIVLRRPRAAPKS